MESFLAPLVVALSLLLGATLMYYKTKINQMKTSNEEQIRFVQALWFSAGYADGMRDEADAEKIRNIYREFMKENKDV